MGVLFAVQDYENVKDHNFLGTVKVKGEHNHEEKIFQIGLPYGGIDDGIHINPRLGVA